jgi:hypothetical protein
VVLPYAGEATESGAPIEPEADGSYPLESGTYVFEIPVQ